MMKPILFNTAMVQAILEGRKTTTRRIIKVNSSLDFIGCSSEDGCEFNRAAFGKGSFDKLLDAKITDRLKALYMPGNILYVRETWMIQSIKNYEKNIKFLYKAEPNPKLNEVNVSDKRYEELLKYECKNGWQPSLFMPKEAARIFLKVKDVRVERLQDITEDGCLDEGMSQKLRTQLGYASEESQERFNLIQAKDTFRKVWRSTLKKYQIDQYGWAANPWVWVIEFERCEKPIE